MLFFKVMFCINYSVQCHFGQDTVLAIKRPQRFAMSVSCVKLGTSNLCIMVIFLNILLKYSQHKKYPCVYTHVIRFRPLPLMLIVHVLFMKCFTWVAVSIGNELCVLGNIYINGMDLSHFDYLFPVNITIQTIFCFIEIYLFDQIVTCVIKQTKM